VVGDVEALPGRVISLFADAGTWLLNAGEHLLSGLWDGAEKVPVIGNLLSTEAKIVGLFADAGTWLLDAGKNLLEGLWHGIDGEAKTLLKNVEGVGKKVLHDLTHPWDIASPSKATAQSGAYLIQGITIGMRQEQAALLASVGEISQAVKVEFAKLGTLDTGLSVTLGHQGLDAGRQFALDFGIGLADNKRAITSALASLTKEAQTSALRDLFVQSVNAGGSSSRPTAPGSSVTTQYNFNGAVIQANDPAQLERAVQMRTRRKNLVRT
jgi:hypothetical protein